MRSVSSRRGFTLVEVIVSVTLLATGVVSVLGALSSMNRSQARLIEVEHVQRLAMQKIDELLATEQVSTTSLSGDFTDQNEPDYQWTADVSTSGVENLQTLTLTVTKSNADATAPSAAVDTLFYQAPANTAGTATP